MGGLRVSLLQGLAASFFILVGCGGRTSTLDPDAIYLEPNRPSGTAGASNSASKPNPTTGTAGATNTPPIGKPAGNPGTPAGSTGGSGTAGSTGTPSNTPGTNPSTGGSAGATSTGGSSSLDPWVISKCNDFCNANTQAPCPTSPSSADCTKACLSELLSTGSQICQKYGGSLLECLTKVYQNSSNCRDVDRLSIAKCSTQFESYQSCGFDVPAPPPPPDPQTCSTSSIVGDTTCYLDMECTNRGHFNVYCNEGALPDQANCNCYGSFPDGSGFTSNLSLGENVSSACVDALSLCGIPQPGLK